MMEINNSNHRIQEVLLLPEKTEKRTSKTEELDQRIRHIKFESYSAIYPGQTHPSLKSLNFEIQEGSLLGVIGLVMIHELSSR